MSNNKQKKQVDLFGFAAAKGNFYCYRDPSNDHECFVERYCLRNKSSGKSKRGLVDEAVSVWKNDFKTVKDKKERELKVAEFLKLKPGEKPFVRYVRVM